MSAMVPQHHLLGRRREQAKSGHTNTLATTTDISWGGETAFLRRSGKLDLDAAFK
jgi:hypothetical protein